MNKIVTINPFHAAITDCLDDGITNVNQLSNELLDRLTAFYIQQSDTITAWEFITEPDLTQKLPWLLAKLLLTNESCDRHAINQMIEAMQKGARAYGKSFIQQELDAQYKHLRIWGGLKLAPIGTRILNHATSHILKKHKE